MPDMWIGGERMRMIKENGNEFECPVCKAKDSGLIVDDYTDRHNRETMVECMECDSIYVVHHVFERIEILRKKEISEKKAIKENIE